MHRRLNITLPEETVRMWDRRAKTGGRSHLIDEAVRELVQRRQVASLGKQLEEGARRRVSRDLAMTEEWSLLDDEAWLNHRE
jgi:CopG family transcriptional regulator/antitoxin EndoAI